MSVQHICLHKNVLRYRCISCHSTLDRLNSVIYFIFLYMLINENMHYIYLMVLVAFLLHLYFFTGMLCVGLGESQVNGLFAAMNMPGISKRHLKKREREVGVAVENVAQESAQAALQEEIDATTDKYLPLFTF